MRLQNTYFAVVLSFLMFFALSANAQSKAYKRAKPEPKTEAPTGNASTGRIPPRQRKLPKKRLKNWTYKSLNKNIGLRKILILQLCKIAHTQRQNVWRRH